MKYETTSLPTGKTDEENALLGALILEPSLLPDVVRILGKGDFSESTNATLYAELTAMFDAGEAIDTLTLPNRPAVIAVFGGSRAQACRYVVGLTQKVASGANVQAHALIVKQEAIRRRLWSMCRQFIDRTADPAEDVADLLSSASAQLDEIAESAVTGGGLVPLWEAARQELANVEERARTSQDGGLVGIPTGFPSLDELTGGWRGGQLIVVGGRPAMGKSAILQHFALTAAASGVPVCWFSLEMNAEELAGRILVGQTGIGKGNYRSGCLSGEERKRLEVTVDGTRAIPVMLNDAANLTLRDIRSQVIPLARQGKCGLVAIDYLQLLKPAIKANNREQEVAQISRSAKLLAKELRVPVLLLAQLSRQSEARADKTPILSDLRESGAIEQDADMVIFVDRPEMRGEGSVANGISSTNTGRLLVAKHRHGGPGMIIFRHDGAMTRIAEYDVTAEPFSKDGCCRPCLP